MNALNVELIRYSIDRQKRIAAKIPAGYSVIKILSELFLTFLKSLGKCLEIGSAAIMQTIMQSAFCDTRYKNLSLVAEKSNILPIYLSA